MPTALRRRELLLGMGVLGLGARLATDEASAMEPVDWLPGKLSSQWRHLVRMQKSTAPGDVPWWYTGRIYAQVGEEAPVHLFNLEGTEIYWVEPRDDGAFDVSSRTLTFFRDRETGEMLREFRNPFTGALNLVTPNTLGGRNSMGLAPDGWHFERDSEGAPVKNPWSIDWQRSGGLVWFTSSRGSRGPLQPWLECMTTFCAEKQLMDATIPSVDAHFSSTYFSPWQRWLDMADHPGHLIWHSSGRKLASADEIPDEYRLRAELEFGAKLTANPASYD